MFENWEVAPYKWQMSPRAAVKRLGKAEWYQILFVACILVGVVALGSFFWFLRAHYFNATNAGWGDPEQDRHQWLLGWSVRISAIVALISAVMIAIRSKRALISMAGGTAFYLLVYLVGFWIPGVGFILTSLGWFAAIATFGVHSDGYEVAAYFIIINVLIYSSIVFLLIRKRIASGDATSDQEHVQVD